MISIHSKQMYKYTRSAHARRRRLWYWLVLATFVSCVCFYPVPHSHLSAVRIPGCVCVCVCARLCAWALVWLRASYPISSSKTQRANVQVPVYPQWTRWTAACRYVSTKTHTFTCGWLLRPGEVSRHMRMCAAVYWLCHHGIAVAFGMICASWEMNHVHSVSRQRRW